MSRTIPSGFRNILAAHPILDQVLPLVGIVAWIAFGQPLVPDNESMRTSFYLGSATISGLAMAASTFVCAMTYQSANILMAKTRDLYGPELRRNWVAVIGSHLVTATTPIFAIVIDGHSTTLAMGVTLYALLLLFARFSRGLWWLQFTLFMDVKSSEIPERVEIGIREDLA